METRSRLQENTSRGGDGSERSGEASPPGDAREPTTPPTRNAPNPQVHEKPRRRQFSAPYKLKILQEADDCTQFGQLGALLRREGLYSSHLRTWRRQRDDGTLAALAPKRRGRKPKHDQPLVKENEQLLRENQRLKEKLRQTEIVIDVQKKLCEVFERPPTTNETTQNDK